MAEFKADADSCATLVDSPIKADSPIETDPQIRTVPAHFYNCPMKDLVEMVSVMLKQLIIHNVKLQVRV